VEITFTKERTCIAVDKHLSIALYFLLLTSVTVFQLTGKDGALF